MGPILGDSDNLVGIRQSRLRDHFDEGRPMRKSFFSPSFNSIAMPLPPLDLVEAEVDQARGWAEAAVEAAEVEAQRQIDAVEANMAMEIDEAAAAAAAEVAEAQEWAKEEVAEAQAEARRERSAAEAAMKAEEKALRAEAGALAEVAEVRAWANEHVAAAQAEAQRKMDAARVTIAEEKARLATLELQKGSQVVSALETFQFDAEADAARSAAEAAEAREWAEKQVSAALAEAEAAAARAKKASALVVELQSEVSAARATAANATSFLNRARELEAALAARQLQENELQVSLAALNTSSKKAEAQVLELQQELYAAQEVAVKEKAKSEILRKKVSKLEAEVHDLKQETAADSASRLEIATKAAVEVAIEEVHEWAEREVEAAQAEAQRQVKIAAEANAEVLKLKGDLNTAQVAAVTMASAAVKNTRASMEAQIIGIAEKVMALESEMDDLKSEMSSEALEASEAKEAADKLVVSLEAKLGAQMAESESAYTAQDTAAATVLRDRVRELEGFLERTEALEQELRSTFSALRSESSESKLCAEELQRKLELAQITTAAATAKAEELKEQLAKRPSELSYKEALRWFHKAAEGGDAQAQLNLGIVYMNGHGVAQSDKEAVRMWLKSAEQGNAMAQNNLGYFYWSGRGVPKSYTEAVKWYRDAAEQDFADAQANLGLAYYKGQGVKRDFAEAMKWYRKAADQGQTTALRKLESMRALMAQRATQRT
jgi:TPR repeat protein